GTGVTTDKDKNKAEILKSEETGFALDRNNPELYLIKGKRLFYENNMDGAAAELKKAIEIDGSRAHYHVELARVLMKKEGGAKDAEAALNKALGMNPNSPKLIAMLGHALMKQNKLDDALKAYERAVKEPGSKNPEARLSMGRIYRARKDYANAIPAFEKAAQEYVGQSYQVAQSLDEQGQTYEAKGDKAKAPELYEKAMNADADYEDAYCHYAKFLSADPKSRTKAKLLAQAYLKLAPRGDCAADMTKL
ncbi:MAG: tetratricopeptide repeat protein, partial [Myxococcaceae bacterium]